MQEFNVTIVNENRLYIGLLVLFVGLFGSILLGLTLGSSLWFLLSFLGLLGLLFYYLVGNLTVIGTADRLQFRWKKKLFFNYNDIEAVAYGAIETLVIDHGDFLRKIITPGRIISINTTRLDPKDASKLAQYLKQIAKERNIEILDSWDVVAEKEYVQPFYGIHNIVLILVGILVITFIAIKGFQPVHLFFLLLLLPKLYFMLQRMKQNKDKKER
jgi:hypothetical protein